MPPLLFYPLNDCWGSGYVLGENVDFAIRFERWTKIVLSRTGEKEIMTKIRCRSLHSAGVADKKREREEGNQWDMKSMPTITNTGNRQSSAMITSQCVYEVFFVWTHLANNTMNVLRVRCTLMDGEKTGRCYTLENEKWKKLVREFRTALMSENILQTMFSRFVAVEEMFFFINQLGVDDC